MLLDAQRTLPFATAPHDTGLTFAEFFAGIECRPERCTGILVSSKSRELKRAGLLERPRVIRGQSERASEPRFHDVCAVDADRLTSALPCVHLGFGELRPQARRSEASR